MAGSIVSTYAQHRTRGVVKINAAITTDSSGVASATIVGAAYGKLVAIGYAPGTLDTGAVITVSDENGTALLTLSSAGTSARYFRPSSVVANNAGTAVTAATTAPNVNRVLYVGGKLQITVASGGNVKSGNLHLVIDESDLGAAGVGQGG